MQAADAALYQAKRGTRRRDYPSVTAGPADALVEEIMDARFTEVTMPLRRSLRRRLPIVASALIAGILGAFLWVAFRQVENAFIEAGGARAHVAADHLANLLSESGQLRLHDVQRVARHAAVRSYLQHDQSDEASAAARAQLSSIMTQGQQIVELWNATGVKVLAVNRPPRDASASEQAPLQVAPGTSPEAAGLSKFRVANGVIQWDAVAEVLAEDPPGQLESPKPVVIGHVVSRRLLSTTSSSDAISRLVGNGAVVMVGNQAGDVWSDLTTVVPGPPAEVWRNGLAAYKLTEGPARIGAGASINATPWAVWVEFPRSIIVAPAWLFLGRMLLFGSVFVVAAALIARTLSQRITKPLHDLTQAAEAIAAGKSHDKVDIQRPDEIGRLGAAFNEMAEQVRSVQRDLEARVAQRTASLAQAEERTKAILRSANDAFVGMDAAGRIVTWNTQAESIFGWTSEEVMGRRLTETIISDAHRESEEPVLERHLRVDESGVVHRRLELVSCRRDGEEFPVEVTIWSSGTGSDQAFHAFVRDITERKRAEKAVSDAKTEAERASQAKNEFLSRMSHDLRTPLNAILGFAQLLEMDDLRSEQLESVHLIRRGGKHLLELINEVLDISRIEAGQLSLSQEPVDVADVVGHAVDLIAPLAAHKNITLDVTAIAHSTWMVTADRQRLTQILLNLLSNAIKYNRENGCVTVTCEEVAGGRLQIRVRDTGAGIPPEKLQRLFRPFERLGAETTAIEGTGLGLALSRGLAAAMGGSLGVASEVDRGTTFWVELQLAEAVDPVATDTALTSEGAAAPRAGGTVLYVEDNLANVRLMERVFERRSHVTLVHAPNGGQAIAMAARLRPDLVFLDLHLPDMDGAEVLRRVLEDRALRSIPVVMLSADATPDQARRLKAAGARAYLTKPLDVAVVLQMLDDLLNEARMGHAAATVR